MSRFGTLRIGDKQYDLDDLSLDDMEEAEGLLLRQVKRDDEWIMEGTPLAELNFGSAKVTKVLAWICLRQDNPELTLEEVGQIKLVAFAPGEEEMPETHPLQAQASSLNLNSSEPAGSGVLGSDTSSPDSSLGTSDG